MKKKLLLTLAIIAIFACIFAISVSAADYDTTRKVTLNNGTEVDLYDESGNALTYYLSGDTLTSAKTVDLITVDGNGWILYRTDVEGFTGASSVVVANFQDPDYESKITNGIYGLNVTYRYSKNLEYVYFADEIKSFAQWYAFSETGIKVAEFTPNSQLVNFGQQYMFHNCASLTSFYFPPLVKAVPNGDDPNIGFLSKCTSLKTVTIANQETFTHLGNSFLSGSTAIEEITLPDSITYLGTNAFRNCSSLSKVNLPSGVTRINDGTFFGCKAITEFMIPDYVTYVGGEAFRATGIVNSPFTANSQCVEWGYYTFRDCDSLKNFIVPRSLKIAAQSSSYGPFSECAGIEKITFGTYVDPENGAMTSLPSAFFAQSNIKEIELPEGLVHIGDRAFYYLNGVTEIKLPNTVETAGQRAFQGCKSLETIYLGSSFKHIINTENDYCSFTHDAGAIKNIYIPASFYKEAPSEDYRVGYTFNGGNGNTKYFYTGSAEDFAKTLENFKSAKGAGTNNGRFTGATIITKAQYEANQDSYATGNYIIVGYNPCDVFHNGNHAPSTTTYDFKGEDYVSDYCSYAGCPRCNNTVETVICGPLFTDKGYAKEENGSLFTYGIVFNKSNIATFLSKQEEGYTFNYGLIIASAEINAEGVLFDENGKAIEGTLSFDVTAPSYTIYNLKLTGIKDTQKDMAVYACAYIVDNGAVSYVGDGVTENAVSVTYNSIKAIIPEETKENA